MIRLAICTDTYAPQINGVARTLQRLARAVEERGGAVHVFTTSDPRAEADPDTTRVPSIPFWAYRQLRMAAPVTRAARRVIETFRPTLVHAATPFGIGIGARAAARALGVPLVTSYHTHFTAYLRHYRLGALTAISWPFLRWFHNGGLATFAPSETVRRDIEGHGFRNTRVWTRGVDASRFNPRFRSRTVRASLGAPDETVVVLYVGRLAPEKGIGPAVAGISRALVRHRSSAVFAVTGDGPAEARVRRAAPSGTTFTGPLTGDALSAMYASADVLVFPSLTETFGNVALEAMASGVAVIAPDRGPTTEFATAETALLCDVADPRAIEAAVSRLITDRALRAAIAERGLAAARERTWETIFDRLLAEYSVVVGTRDQRPETRNRQGGGSGLWSPVSGL